MHGEAGSERRMGKAKWKSGLAESVGHTPSLDKWPSFSPALALTGPVAWANQHVATHISVSVKVDIVQSMTEGLWFIVFPALDTQVRLRVHCEEEKEATGESQPSAGDCGSASWFLLLHHAEACRLWAVFFDAEIQTRAYERVIAESQSPPFQSCVTSWHSCAS